MDHRLDVGITVLRTLGDHAVKHLVQLRRDPWPADAQRRDRRLAVGNDLVNDGVALIHAIAGHQAVQRAAQRINIGSLIGRVHVAGLLGGHVIDRPHDDVRAGQPDRAAVVIGLRLHAGQAHVEHLYGSIVPHQQVVRLDIAMDHTIGMGISQPLGRLQQVVQRLLVRNRTFALADSIEVLSLDVLHHQVMNAIDLVGIERRDDVGMREQGRRFDLATEPPHRIGRAHRRTRQHLQRHEPPHHTMASLIHLAHAPLAQLVQHKVLSQHQLAGVSLISLNGLVAGDQLAPHQLAGQLLGIRRPLGQHRPQLFDGQNTDRSELTGKVFQGKGHAVLDQG